MTVWVESKRVFETVDLASSTSSRSSNTDIEKAIKALDLAKGKDLNRVEHACGGEIFEKLVRYVAKKILINLPIKSRSEMNCNTHVRQLYPLSMT